MFEDVAGNLYIADRENHRVRHVDPMGTITTVAGSGQEGFSGDGGLATKARLNRPSGVHVDPEGNLYIADWDNHRVRQVDTAGIIRTIAGDGFTVFLGDGDRSIQTSLEHPSSVFVDGDSRLYIADAGSNRVLRITPTTGEPGGTRRQSTTLGRLRGQSMTSAAGRERTVAPGPSSLVGGRPPRRTTPERTSSAKSTP